MEVFSIAKNGHSLLGRAWETPTAKANIVFFTGMEEHALRYADFASYLNDRGISLYVLDAPGQGLNIDEGKGKLPQVWVEGDFDRTVSLGHEKLLEVKTRTALPTGIMGHSMGSFMTQRFLELYPGEADFVGIIGSNGPCLAKMKISYFLASLIVNGKNAKKPSKFIQSLGIGAYERAIKDRKGPLDWLSYSEENIQAYHDDPLCGITNTNIFWKEFLRGMSHLYEKREIGKVSPKERILILAGEGDPVGEMGIGIERLKKMYEKQGVQDLRVIVYPKMRHEILNEEGKAAPYGEIAAWALKGVGG